MADNLGEGFVYELTASIFTKSVNRCFGHAGCVSIGSAVLPALASAAASGKVSARELFKPFLMKFVPYFKKRFVFVV